MATIRSIPQRFGPMRVEVLLTILVFLVTARTGYLVNEHHHATMLSHGSDPYGYYQFLPALLGTHDWGHLPWAFTMEDGKGLSLFTMGVAWMLLPFFLLATAWASLCGYPVDGYSHPYVMCQFLAAAFYLAAGCLLLFHALRDIVGRPLALLTPMLLLGATNLFFYSTYEPGMSHVYAFFLFAALLYLTLRMLEDPGPGKLFLLLACGGLLVLIRQLNVIALLLPLFLGARNPMEALRIRWGWLRAYPLAAGGGVLVAALLFLPQLIYLKYITGSVLVFTYGKKGEGFNWTEPHLWDVLFSHQNGWFVHTPLMIFVMVALVIGAFRGAPNMRPILLIWLLAWYIYSSWWSWWLGGSFGHRGFIEHYAFLSIPLAMGLKWIWDRGRLWRDLSYVPLYLLVFINIRLSTLYFWPWEGPDWNWEKLIDIWERVP